MVVLIHTACFRKGMIVAAKVFQRFPLTEILLHQSILSKFPLSVTKILDIPAEQVKFFCLKAERVSIRARLFKRWFAIIQDETFNL